VAGSWEVTEALNWVRKWLQLSAVGTSDFTKFDYGMLEATEDW